MEYFTFVTVFELKEESFNGLAGYLYLVVILLVSVI